MKVKDIVNNLNKFYAPDDDLVIAWWDTEYFAECITDMGYQLTKDDLETIGDMSIDTEYVSNEITDYVRELVSDRLNTIEQDEKHLEAQAELEQQEQELWDTDETNA